MNQNEELIQKCIELILKENSASVALLRRRLKIGYKRANRIMNELERRGVVGPAKSAEAGDILIARPKPAPVCHTFLQLNAKMMAVPPLKSTRKKVIQRFIIFSAA